MKRFLLLPILLSVINILPISAQVMEGAETKGLVYLPEEQSRLRQENQVDGHSFSRPRKADETTPVRFAIKAGVAGFCRDYNGNAMTMPAAMDSVRFEIIDAAKRTVMIGTTDEETDASKRNGWPYYHRAIYNPNYTGAIDIPSQVKYNNQWYDVVKIPSSAFYMMRTDIPSTAFRPLWNNTNCLTSTIKIHVKNLEEIGTQAFPVQQYTDSYYSVDIKSDKYLTIAGGAFGENILPTNVLFADMTTPDWLDNPDRRELETVKIVADGMYIGGSAFYRAGLRTVDITSTGGKIAIGANAFCSGTMSYHVNVYTKDTLIYRPLNSDWERRSNKTDYIRINGPVQSIGQNAFRGHFNIQEVTINDPRTDSSTGTLSIGANAFYGLFNGDASQGKITIKGPLNSIGMECFAQKSWLINNGKMYTPGGKLIFEIPTGKRYDNSLTTVQITNTGENNMYIGKNAFSNNFIYTDYAKAAASVTLKGKIYNIAQNSFTKLDDANAPNGLRLRTITIENTNLSSVSSATLPNLTIGKKAFYQTMTSTLPDVHGTVSISGPIVSIADSAFCQPTSLMNLTINNTGTTNLTIGESAFRHGFKRTAGNAGSIKITGPLSKISQYAFEFPTNVMSVDIQNTGTTAMTVANNTFAQGFRRDAAGGKINITGPMREIGDYAFHLPTYCDNITINNTHTTSGLSIGLNAFEKAFQRAAHGTANITGNLLKIGKNAFHTPTNLMTLNINNNVGNSALVVDSAAFRNGFRRTEGNLGTISIQGRLSRINYCAVGWGHNANSITINNTGTNDLVIEKWAFPQAFRRANTAGGDITITGRLKEIGAEAFHLVANCKKVTINNTGSGTDLVIGEKAFAGGFTKYTDAVGGILAITGKLKEIGVNAFNGCTNLMDVQISNGTSTYDLVIGENAFKGAYLRNAAGGLFKVIDGKISSIKKTTFDGATYLQTIDIVNTKSSGNLTIEKQAFRNCMKHDSHGTVSIVGKVSSIADSCFVGTSNLMNVTLDNSAGTASLTIGESAFRHGFKRTAGNAGAVTIKGKLAEIKQYAFEYPTNLMAVDIQNTGTTDLVIANQTFPEGFRRNAAGGTVSITGRLKSIGKWAFNNNTYMQNVTINNTGSGTDLEIIEQAFQNGFRYAAAGAVSITGKIKSIGINAFNGGTNMQSLTLRNNASTNALTISKWAFRNCFRHASAGTVDFTNNCKIAAIADSAFYGPTNLNTVKIANAATNALTIGKHAFANGFRYDTNGLISLTGNLGSISDGAFYASHQLQSLTINNTGSTALNIGKNAFDVSFRRTGTTGGKVDIQGNLASIGQYAIAASHALNDILINNTGSTALAIGNAAFRDGITFDNNGINPAAAKAVIKGNLGSIGTQAFSFLSSNELKGNLTSVTITNTGSTDLTIGANAFARQYTREVKGTLAITGKLKEIGASAFATTPNLMDVQISNGTSTNDLVIGENAFKGAYLRNEAGGLFKVIDGKISSIKKTTFDGATYLQTVNIVNTKSSGNLTIEKRAFQNCMKHDSHGKLSVVGKIISIADSCFVGSTNLMNVTLNNASGTADLSIGKNAFYDLFKRTDGNVGSVTINGKVQTIGENAFYGGTNLMTVDITHTTSASNLTIGENAFYNCFLRTATPTGTLTMNGKLATIGKNAFRYDRGLKTVSITNSGTAAAVIDTMAFYAGIGCKAQSSAFGTYFTDGMFTYTGPLKELGYQAFYDCYGLGTVNVNTTSEFRIMDMCFRYNRSLSELNSDNGKVKRSIPSMVRYIGTYAFQNTGFTEMTIPDLTLKPSWNPNITESNPMKQTLINQGKGDELYPASSTAHDWYNINGNFGDYIFADCRNLQKVTINSTTTGGRAVFRNCKELTDVTLGSKVRFIEQYSFEGCTKLDHLFVPKTVSLIGTGIMYRGAPAHRITFEGTQPPHAVSNAFNGNKPNLVVPKGSVSSYLFSADNLGFQQVAADNISCEYNLASSGWGSLGMQAHKIKEYKATVNAGRVEWLSIVDDRGTFTDVYDTRRIGVTNVDGIVTDVAPSDVVNVYTADYYYPETKKVGIDKIENFAVVPQNTSTTNRNIGYLVEGEGGTTYYLHHYTGGDMSSKIAANGETYSYGTVRDAAKSAFDSEDIPCPGAFGGSTYSRTDAPNLLIAYTGTTYTQGQNLVIDGGKYFGTEPCYYYGFAGGQFRKINGWSNFKEGNAFIAIPKRLMDESAAGKEVLSFFLMDNGDGDDWKTTGIDDLNNDGRHIEGGRDEWYTIDGIKLTERPTKKGLYIHNGRKEAIR
ncbi:MAG: leucine-rich repeat protein [Prevotella sp.]|nr:leucine-rich repeat protein [Prevotella sp.]